MKSVDDILNIIEEEDVEFIRLQFADIYGKLKNIAVTPGQIDRVIKNQYSIEGSVMFDGKIEIAEELYLHPVLDSFVILPWRPQQGRVGKFICDVCYEDGTPFESCPRAILKKVTEEARKEGYTFSVTPECEFFLFHTDDNGAPTTVSHERASYLDVGPVDFGENARRELVLTLEEMGFEIESSHHEKALAQHEIDFTQGEALETADAIMTFKFAVRSIAKRFGLYATFMPKPRTDQAGSGMHLNFAMYKDGKNLFDVNKKGEVTDCAKHFVAGILSHAEGMCVITNPIVNSYKRLISGYDAPGEINWSTKNEKKSVVIRKSFNETKVEVRFPDPSANPYLAIAVCIAAGLDGVKNKTELDKEYNKKNKPLPCNLKDALRHFKKDKFIIDVIGEKCADNYAFLKTGEWNEYMLEVSDWEIKKYLGKM